MEFTRFEKARIISARALQVSFGAPALIKTKGFTEPYEIAVTEYNKKVLPLTVLRDREFIRFKSVDAIQVALEENIEEVKLKKKTKKTEDKISDE